jgi:hypothetical protein
VKWQKAEKFSKINYASVAELAVGWYQGTKKAAFTPGGLLSYFEGNLCYHLK